MKKIFIADRHKAFLIISTCIFVCSLLIVGTVVRYKILSQNSQMQFLAVSKSNEIIEAIYALLYKAEALSTLVIQGDGEIRELERIAPIIINSPVIRNILLAPDGIVTKVYPLDTNRPLMGYDLLGPGDGNEEALQAKEKGQLTLGGPFTGMQGGDILVGRLPVYTYETGDRNFWGLVSVTLNYPESLAPVRLAELANMGFACEIWRINPDRSEKQVILRTGDSPLNNPIEKEFRLLNAQWKISIAPLEPWYKSLSLYAMLGAAVLVSLLTGIVAQSYWEMSQLRTSLERMAMYDCLTGLPNRRAAFDRLNTTLTDCAIKGNEFILGYIDLNGFKDINDSYGHHIGDHVLKETAQRIVDCMPGKQFVGRIGGDEFIFILTEIAEADVEDVVTKLHEAMNKPFAPKLMENLRTSLSVGLAVFPRHGTTSEELTLRADADMYRDKEQHRRRQQGHHKQMTALALLTRI